MKVSDFYYNLPENLIAQEPLLERDKSRLLIIRRKEISMEEDFFYNLKEYLNPGDCLVLNDSKVIPARLFAIKKETGAKIEILLINEIKKNFWTVLIKPYKRVKIGTILILLSKNSSEKSNIRCVIKNMIGEGIAEIKFFKEKSNKETFKLIDNEELKKDIFLLGKAPIPPYIKNPDIETNRYQTIYAKEEGSIAAPTAGLHFTDKILKDIKKKDIEIATITLHVSLDTFRPIKVDNIEEHVMHSEQFYIKEEQSEVINQAKANSGRIIAVGTTTTRALETVAEDGKVKPFSGRTDLFITPEYKFKIVDGLLTNFHLPCSTLFIMVCTFANRDLMNNAYNLAIEKKYRFYTFGDAMLIL